MVNYYDELEIEDFSWDPKSRVYHYPCPCGDRFEISKAQLRDGEEIATCPSCSLIVRVIYDQIDWEDYATTEDGDETTDSEESSPLDVAQDEKVLAPPSGKVTNGPQIATREPIAEASPEYGGGGGVG